MIYIDVSVLTLATFLTGIQRVTREYTLRFLQDPELKGQVCLLYYNASKDSYFRIDSERYVDFYAHGRGRKERMITKRKVAIEDFRKGDIWFEVDAGWMDRMKRSYLLPQLKKRGVRITLMLHDIISHNYPQFCLERGLFNFQDFLGAYLLCADKIICTSRATEGELLALGRELNVSVPETAIVPLGSNFVQSKAEDAAVTDELSEEVRRATEHPFVLMAGTIEPRKNHKLLLAAYPELKKLGYSVVFAGYLGWDMEEFAETIHSHPDFGNGIYHLVGPSDRVMNLLYDRAKFLIFCSYAEGFGLPLVEALQRGTPVLAADMPVFREVGEGYCIWFPQDDAQALADRVRFYEQHPDDYKDLKQSLANYRGHTWEEAYAGIRREL